MQKMHPSRIPARFGRVESQKNATVSRSRLLLLITHYSNCSSQISNKFEPWKEVGPDIEILVWDFVFFGSGRPEAFLGASKLS